MWGDGDTDADGDSVILFSSVAALVDGLPSSLPTNSTIVTKSGSEAAANPEPEIRSLCPPRLDPYAYDTACNRSSWVTTGGS